MQQDIWTLKQTSCVGTVQSVAHNASTKFGEVIPRTPANRLSVVPHSVKLHGVNVLNRQLLVDYSISLKFCIEFKRMTLEVL